MRKKVLVVGGGQAGMEVARVARMRGHDVSLYEKEQELGGQVNLAARIPSRNEFGGCTRYLAKQMEILGVQVHQHSRRCRCSRPDGATGRRAGYGGHGDQLPGEQLALPGTERESEGTPRHRRLCGSPEGSSTGSSKGTISDGFSSRQVPPMVLQGIYPGYVRWEGPSSS